MATPGELALLTGEDKFRVHDILVKLRKSGVCQVEAYRGNCSHAAKPFGDDVFSLVKGQP